MKPTYISICCFLFKLAIVVKVYMDNEEMRKFEKIWENGEGSFRWDIQSIYTWNIFLSNACVGNRASHLITLQ